MTINATAMWLLALYQVVAEEQAEAAGEDPREVVHRLTGTTQNDIIKEYLSRGTYVFPPAPSLRLITRHDRVHGDRDPQVEPDQHLQLPPAGGRGHAGAGAGVRAVHRDRRARRGARLAARCRRSGSARSSRGSRSSSTPGSASSRRCARCGRSSSCGTSSPRERYGVQNPKQRRFRYGVQVNSLGLTEAQPENNVSGSCWRCSASRCPRTRGPARCSCRPGTRRSGLPRPWDQQWSLRIQQVLAFESDLLEYDDLFDGSRVIEAKVGELVAAAAAEIDRVAGHGRGGGRRRVRLHEGRSWSRRTRQRRRRHRVRARTSSSASTASPTTEPSPLTADLDTAIQRVDPAAEQRRRSRPCARGGPTRDPERGRRGAGRAA